MNNNSNHSCCHEERFASIESELAEINVRLDTKKEDIQQIQSERDSQQRLQTELIEKVTRVTVLLEEGQKQRENNNKKMNDLEDKIDEMKTELANYKNDMTDFVSSQRSFRNTMMALIPVISIIVGVILHFIKV